MAAVLLLEMPAARMGAEAPTHLMRYLITGGTGTFGHAFARSLLADPEAERIAILSRDEFKQGQMARELGDDSRLRFFLGDVRDHQRLEQAFHGIDVVVHAAALKRVDAIAYSSEEAIKTNVLGTMNVCQAAISQGVQRVVLLSSDKAVHATNFYGASKFLAEHVAIGSNVYGVPKGTSIAVTRYGNVLGSRGSVVEIWRAQAREGQPLTLTSPLMTRFWMTLNQAVGLVRLCLERMQGGEIFIPKLKAMNLAKLARIVAPDGRMTITGLRPGGEKLAEVLVSDEEISRTHDAGDCYIVAPSMPFWRASEPDYGPLVSGDFRYASDTVAQLEPRELAAFLA